MLFKKLVWAVIALLVATALAACNLNVNTASGSTPDVNALYTAAAGTLITQFNDSQTQTAAANSATALASPTALATFTPLPTFPFGAGLTPFGTLTFGTPLPTLVPAGTVVNGFAVGCNNAVYIGETKPYDKTEMDPQKAFAKAWSLLNTGTCTWDEGYSFNFKSGERLDGDNIKIVQSDDFTKPGHSLAFVVHLYAPKKPGEYIGYWQMKDDASNWFGSLVSVDIIVK